MLVVCASKLLKKPIEFDIEEEQYKKITSLSSSEQQQSEIAKLAIEHIKKYGYNLGNGKKIKKNIDLNMCLECGLKNGKKVTEWNLCRYKNINYQYPVNKKSVINSTKLIKDDKIRKALELTKEERMIANQFFLRD